MSIETRRAETGLKSRIVEGGHVKGLQKRTARVAALVMMAFHLVAGFVYTDDMVLCVAENGRISIEEAEEGKCTTSHDDACAETRDGAPAACRWSRGGCCGSCLDIPISLSSSDSHQVPASGELSSGRVPSASPCQTVLILTDSSTVGRPDAPDVTPVARSALTMLRTAVIII